MERYEHTSVGCDPRLALGVGAAAGLLISISLLRVLGAPSVPVFLLYAAPSAFFPALFVWATALHVEIDARRLRWRFGYGGPSWSVALAEIQLVDQIQYNGWNGGIGFRELQGSRFGGYNYCVGIGQGVRVELRNGKRFGIETDEPKTLTFVLREAMKAEKEN